MSLDELTDEQWFATIRAIASDIRRSQAAALLAAMKINAKKEDQIRMDIAVDDRS